MSKADTDVVSTQFKSCGEMGKVDTNVYTRISLQFFSFTSRSYTGVSVERNCVPHGGIQCLPGEGLHCSSAGCVMFIA